MSRVTLRPVRDDDLPAIEPWYGEAAAAVHGLPEPVDVMNLGLQLEDARAADDGGLLVIERDAETVGLIDYRDHYPGKGWATIGCIALKAGRRGWGYGAEALRLLEAGLGARSFAATVDRNNGLGLYFWLRMGYRPAHAGEVFWRRPDEDDTIAMVRLGENPVPRT